MFNKNSNRPKSKLAKRRFFAARTRPQANPIPLSFECLEDRQMMAIDLVADIVQTPNSSGVSEIVQVPGIESGGMAMSAYTHEGIELVTENSAGVRTIHTWPNTDLRPMELTHFRDNVGQDWVYFSGETDFSDRELFKLKWGTNQVTRVKDINLNGSSEPKDLTVVGNTIYFTAWTVTSGRELWKTDGTSAGTVLVEDIKSGLGSGSNPEELVKFGSLLFFVADDGIAGQELWISGGTASSTFMVNNINPGAASSDPRELTVAGDKVFFSAFNPASGREVWKSDGINTSILKNLLAGNQSSNPEELTARNNQLFFTANVTGTGRELYWYEPTVINDTLLVKDIYPGAEGSNPTNLTIMNDLLYFAANNPTSGRELWKSNGFFAGTVLVKDLNLNGSSTPHNLVAVGNRLYFAATHATLGTELYKSDGTAASTFMVRDINKLGGWSNPSVMTSVNGRVAFVAENGKDGREVWTSFGGASTTTLHDVFPGTQSSYPFALTQLGNDIYFLAYVNSTGVVKLFRANGDTLGTTTEIATSDSSFNLDFYGASMKVVGSDLYFMKRSVTGNDRFQLFKYVPSTGTTTMLKEIVGPFKHVQPQMITSGNLLYVVVCGADDTYQLWTSNGTAGGTSRLKAGTNFTNIYNTTDVNGRLYFAATVGTGVFQLWRSLGASATTLAIPNLIEPDGFIVKAEQIYFSAKDSTTTNFYRINMTNAPVIIRAGLQSGSLGVNLNGTMYFGALDLTNQAVGYQLWKSNGTPEGTSLVKVINDAGSSSPTDFRIAGGKVFFIANNATSGRELHKTDGTAAGTSQVKNIGPTSTDANIVPLAAFNNELYFRAFDGTSYAIWKSNGTAAGTTKVTEINDRFLREDLIFASSVLAIGNRLYISAIDGLFGHELFAYHI